MQLALDALINGKRVRAYEGGTKYQPPLEDAAIEALKAELAKHILSHLVPKDETVPSAQSDLTSLFGIISREPRHLTRAKRTDEVY
jgi:hypothetical protein